MPQQINLTYNLHRGEYLVKVDELSIASSIFKLVKKYDITKYDVTEPTLNEIFIEKVGAKNAQKVFLFS